jgi:hypothetical protein
MIPITKMRQKTSSRLSCDAIFSDFSREFDRGFAAVALLTGVSGITLASVGATLAFARLAPSDCLAHESRHRQMGRGDREGRHRAAAGKNKENPKRAQLGDVFFDPEAV